MPTIRRTLVFVAAATVVLSAAVLPSSLTLVFQFAIPSGSTIASPSAMTVDSDGNIYVAGSLSVNFGTIAGFPVTADAAQKTPADAFVTKIDRTGTRVVWATFLGGPFEPGHGQLSPPTNRPTAIAIDAERNVWIAGDTSSVEFPTVNPIQSDGRTFLVKLNSQGSQIVFASLLGSATNSGLGVDSIGNAYVALSSITSRLTFEKTSLTTAAGGVAVAKFNPAGGVVYATRFGTGPNDRIADLAVDSLGQAHVVGIPGADDFPVVRPLIPSCPTAGCSFVAKLDPTGVKLVMSTLLAGATTNAVATSVATDANGATYVTGKTAGSDFLIQNAYQSVYGGGGDYFLTKLTPAGTLEYSTYVGGDGEELSAPQVLVDLGSRPMVIGNSGSVNWIGGADIQHVDAPLYKSINAGDTWRRVTGGLRSSVYSLVATRSGAAVWYAGAADGVYRSTDQGEIWQPASDGLGTDKRTYQLAIDPAHADTVFAGTPAGLFRTRDRGVHWTRVDSQPFTSSNPPFGLAVDGNGAVFVGTVGIRRSADGGDTWVDVSGGLDRGTNGSYGTVQQIAFDPSQGGVVYAVTDANRLFRSSDGGSSWSRVQAQLSQPGSTKPFATDVSWIAFPPGRPHWMYARTPFRLLARSTNDGELFESLQWLSQAGSPIVTVPQQPDTIYILDLDSSDRRFPSVSTDAGLHWVTKGVGSFSTSLNGLLVDPRDPSVLLVNATVDSRPLVAMFDQPASHVRFAGFIMQGNVTRVTQDLGGALYALKGSTVLKFKAQ